MSPDKYDVGKNSVRGLAALVVALDHAHGLFIEPYIGSAWTSVFLGLGAHYAVMLFFLVSGYLITMSILVNIEKNGSFKFRDFFISRLARVYPPLVFSVVVCVAVFFIIHELSLPGTPQRPYSIGSLPQMREIYELSLGGIIDTILMKNGLLQANGPLWSLSIEFWIYFLVASVTCIITRRSLWQKIIFTVGLAYCAKALIDVNEYYAFYLVIWVAGAVAALLRSRCGLLHTFSWRISTTLLLLAVALGGLFPNLVLAGGRVFGPAENLMQLVIVAFCASLALPNLRLADNAGGRGLTWLGGYSYTLYIVHFPIMLLVLSLYQQFAPLSLQSSIVTALLAVVLCVAISSISARFFENKKLFAGWLKNGLLRLESYGTRLWSR